MRLQWRFDNMEEQNSFYCLLACLLWLGSLEIYGMKCIGNGKKKKNKLPPLPARRDEPLASSVQG